MNIKITPLFVLKIILVFVISYGPALWASGNGAGITYQGLLLSPSGDSVLGTSVQFRIQLRTPGAENCVMYEEIQTKDLSTTNGIFSITINDGSGTRIDSTGLTLDQVFANRGTFTFASGICASGTSYSPSSTDSRSIQILFNDGVIPSGQWETIPSMAVNFTPTALEAMQVGGYKKEQLLKIADGVNTTGTELSSTDYSNFLALINGSSTQYPTQTAFNALNTSVTTLTASFNTLNTSVKTFAKTTLPTCSGLQVLSSTDGISLNCVSVSAGTSEIVSSGTSTGSLTSTDWNIFNSKQPAGNYITALTGDITSGSITAGTMTTTIAANTISNAQIKTTAAIDDSKLATLTTAGKVSGSAITSGDITTTGNFSTSSNISSSASLRLFDSLTATNKIAIQAPTTGITDYTMTLPAVIGSTNQVLSITGIVGSTASLGWVNPSAGGSGTVTSVATGPGLTGGPFTTTGTISLATSGVTSGSYGSTNSVPGISVDSYGRITAVTPQTIALDGSAITAGTLAFARIPTLNLAGDVTGTLGATSVGAIKGKTVTAAPTAAGQVFRYDGTNLVPTFISMFDLRSTVTGSVTFGSGSTGCTSGQTLTWTSATDNLSCTNIAITSAQVSGLVTSATLDTTNATNITSGTINSARLPASASFWSSATGGINYSSGNVGIGTTTPNQALDISGNVKIQGSPAVTYPTILSSQQVSGAWGYSNMIIRPSGASPTYPGFKLTVDSGNNSETNRGSAVAFAQDGVGTLDGQIGMQSDNLYIDNWRVLGSTNSSGINFRTTNSGFVRMFIAGNGNVGIGTTSPATMLDIAGGPLRITPASASPASQWDAGMFLATPGSTLPSQTRISFGTSTDSGSQIEGGKVGTADSYLAFRTRNTNMNEAMRITSAGNVGIGTTTPTEQLTIVSGGTGVFAIQNTNNTGYSAFNTLNSSGTLVGGTGFGNPGANALYAGKYYLASVGTVPLILVTSGTERLRIDNSGNVGVGTTSPSYKFHVSAGRSLFEANGETYALGLRYNNSNAPDGNFWIGATNASHPDMIFSNDQGSERMRISDAGNVGIGTTSPSAPLEVNGNIKIKSGSGGGITFADGSSQTTATTAMVVGFKATSSSQSIAHATLVNVVYPTVVFDKHSDYNATTGVFTAPIAGTYNCQCQNSFELTGGITTEVLAGFVVTGGSSSDWGNRAACNQNNCNALAVENIYVDSGGTIQCHAYQASADTSSKSLNGGVRTFFSCYRMGP